MCKLNKFLCCLSLETGGIVIGWFNLVLSVIALITLSVLLSLTVIGYYEFDTGATTIIGSFISKSNLQLQFIKFHLQQLNNIFLSLGRLLFVVPRLLSYWFLRVFMVDSRNNTSKLTLSTSELFLLFLINFSYRKIPPRWFSS